MPINKSYGQEMDKRTRELDKRSTGNGANALQEQQLAQNQLQAIQNEQRSNLMSQRTEAAAMAQQNQLLSQAADLGVSSSTAATLGKYGLKSPPRVQRQQGRQVNVTPNKITVINNTNTTTNNQYQGGGGTGDNGSATKFKTWLNKVNMQQAEQASKRDRDYARRESSLTRSANKMLRRIEKVGSSVAESFSPQNFGQTLGSQLKTYLLIFGMRFLTKYWDKILDGLGWFQDTFTSFVGWLGIGEKGKQMANEGKGLVPTIVKLFGGDPKRENVSQAFTRSMKAAFDHFSLKLEHMYEQRAEAIKNVKSPFDGGKAKGLLGEALKDSGIDELFSGISTYLGDILTALVNPKAGVKNNIANSVRETGRKGSNRHRINSTEDYKSNVDYGDYAAFAKKTRRYGMDHNTLTDNGREITNNRGAAVFQSLDILGAYQDAKNTGYVDPARVIAGLERLQKKARSSGFVVVDPDFINQMYDSNIVRTLIQSNHIRAVKYKLVEEKRTEWEKRKAGESVTLMDNMGWYTGAGAVVGTIAGGNTLLGAGVGGAVGAGVNKLRQLGVEENTLRLVPLSDPRPPVQVVLVYEIDEYALRTLARKFGSEGWDAGDEELLKRLRSDLYSKAGGYAATKRRYRGRGSNESLNIDETYKELHSFDHLVAAQKTEEDTDEFSRRQQTVFSTAGSIGNSMVNTVKKGYKAVAGFYNDTFVNPSGGKAQTHYSPSDYVDRGGVGQKASNLVHQVKPPTVSRYGGIRLYTGSSGVLKSPYSTGYKFSTESAAEEAERLCKYIINSDDVSNKGGWQEKSPGAQGKTEYTAAYVRLAIARGLNMNDLPKHPIRACDYVDYLYLYGFYPVDWDGYSPRKGDICVFGPTRDHPNGYLSIYTGIRWVSDFTQKDLWPYDDFRAERCATVFRHLSTVSNKSSSEIAGGIDMAGDAVGYIDFDGDGVFDAVRTPDGTIYKMDESGNIGDKMSVEAFNSQWNPETSSISYMGDSENGLVSYNPGGSYEGPTHIDEYTVSRSVNGNDKWVNAVTQMAKYYRDNIHDYHHRNVPCTLKGVDHVRPDCSGFVSACLVLYGIDFYIKGWAPTAAFIASNSTCADKLRAGGFVKLSRSEAGGIRPFDILVNSSHTEIAAEKPGWAYNCGSRETMQSSTKMPSNHKGFLNEYTVVWRHNTTPDGYGSSEYLQTGGDLVVPSWDAPAGGGNGGGYGGDFSNLGGPGNDGQTYSGTGKLNTDGRIRRGIAALNYLQTKGLTYEQALGVVSNLAVESQMDPWADNKVGAHGIAQWEGDRFEKMKAFVGTGWEHNLKGQLDYLVHELNTSEKNTLKKIMGTNDPALVADYFGDLFERFKGHENKDHERYKLNRGEVLKIGDLYGMNGGRSYGLGGLNDNSGAPGEGFPALPENIDDKIDGAIESVKLVFNDVTDAIKGVIPGLKEGKTEILSHDDKADEKIKAMTDDQLAAQIWNTNANIREEYAAVGFESWKKHQFDRLSRKNKQRYWIEEEAKNILRATNYSVTKGGKSISKNDINQILDVDWDINSAEGQNKFAQFYASLSPEDRRELSARMQLGSEWGKIKEGVLETTDPNHLGYGDYTWLNSSAHKGNVRGIHQLLNAVYFNPESTEKRNRNIFTEDRAGQFVDEDLLSKYIQLGNVDAIREYFEKNHPLSGNSYSLKSSLGDQRSSKNIFEKGTLYDWDRYAERFNLHNGQEYDIKNYNDLAMRQILAMTQTPELYQKLQQNIAKIISTPNFDKLRDLSWDIQERMGNDFKKLPGLSRRKGEVADILGVPEDEVTEQDVYNQLMKFRTMNYDIAKQKYIQLHLTDDFKSIDENTTAQEAQFIQRHNQELAKKNQEIASLEYSRNHRHFELEKRLQNDPNFAREFAFNHGVGTEAMNIYDEKGAGKKELEMLDELIAARRGEREQFLGEGDENTPERLKKLVKDVKVAKAARDSAGVVTTKQQDHLLGYMKTPEQARLDYRNDEKHILKDRDEYVNDLLHERRQIYKTPIWEEYEEYGTGVDWANKKKKKRIVGYKDTADAKDIERARAEYQKKLEEHMAGEDKAVEEMFKTNFSNTLEDLSTGALHPDQVKMLYDQWGIGKLFGNWKKFSSDAKKGKVKLGKDVPLVTISTDKDGNPVLMNNATGEVIKDESGNPLMGVQAFDTLDRLDESGAVSKKHTATFMDMQNKVAIKNRKLAIGDQILTEENMKNSKSKVIDPNHYESLEAFSKAFSDLLGRALDGVELGAIKQKWKNKEDITVSTFDNIPGVNGGRVMQIDGKIQPPAAVLEQIYYRTSAEAADYGFRTDQAKVYDEMKFHANLELQQKMKAISSGQLSFDECMLNQLITLNDGMVKLISVSGARAGDINGDGVFNIEDIQAGINMALNSEDQKNS